MFVRADATTGAGTGAGIRKARQGGVFANAKILSFKGGIGRKSRNRPTMYTTRLHVH
jgi:hypothetical protein